jgi:nucleoside-diphosphate-sugar epimerase
MSERICEHERFPVSRTKDIPLKSIVLFDMLDLQASLAPAVASDKRVKTMAGDLTDRATLDKLLAPDGCTRVTCIQLAALLSGNAENDFDLGMKVNLQGAIGVMEAIRAVSKTLGSPQIYVFTSTDYVACYNENNKTTPVSEEAFCLSPVSYGVQKACVELLLSDYSRKGFIDGRVGRLSAVLGRPGWSNSISWSFTGIFTQTLAGKDFEVPGALPMDRTLPCSCVQNNIESLLLLGGKVDAEELGHNRIVQCPARALSLDMIWKACQEVAEENGIAKSLGKISVGELPKDATVKELNVCPCVDHSKALKLGLPDKVCIKDIIRDYYKRHIASETADGSPAKKAKTS